MLVQPNLVDLRGVILLDDEELTVACEHNIHLALQHVNVHTNVNVHELGLYSKERDPAGKNFGVESTVVGLGHRVLVVKAIVAIDHHGPVAVVTTSGVADEILLAFRAFLIHVVVAAGLSHGVVVTLAVSTCYGITGIPVAVTVAFYTLVSQ